MRVELKQSLIIGLAVTVLGFLYTQNVKLDVMCEKINSIEHKINTGFKHTDREITRIKDHLSAISRECCSELYSKSDIKTNGG
jgi:hypothetical protein